MGALLLLALTAAPSELYWEAEGDGPPIVLLHGLGGSGRYFEGAYRALSDRHRVVRPDLLGFGRSPMPDAGYTVEAHIEALAAAIDAAVGDRALTIVGHSAGALLAIRYATLHPSRVRALVLLSPPLFSSPEAARARIAASGPMARWFVTDAPIGHFACSIIHGFPGLFGALAPLAYPDLPPAVLEDGMRHTWTSYGESLEHIVLRAEGPRWLAAVRAPVYVVAGSEDVVLDLRYLERWAARRRNISLSIWRAGHDLPMQHAARSAALIRRVAALR